MGEDVPSAIVLGVAQRARLPDQFESRLFHFLDHEIFVDSMQGGCVLRAGSGLCAVVDNPVNAALLECRKHRRVHLGAVRLKPHQVVVV